MLCCHFSLLPLYSHFRTSPRQRLRRTFSYSFTASLAFSRFSAFSQVSSVSSYPSHLTRYSVIVRLPSFRLLRPTIFSTSYSSSSPLTFGCTSVLSVRSANSGFAILNSRNLDMWNTFCIFQFSGNASLTVTSVIRSVMTNGPQYLDVSFLLAPFGSSRSAVARKTRSPTWNLAPSRRKRLAAVLCRSWALLMNFLHS